MIYSWLKIIHILSASVLFGTGLGTAFYMFYANTQKDIALIAKATSAVVIADWIFTATSGVIQALTGFLMIYLKGYSISSLWVMGSIIGYFIAGACWLPVVYLQMKCRDLACKAMNTGVSLTREYHLYYKIWVLLGFPAFMALIIVFYLMTNRPEHLTALLY